MSGWQHIDPIAEPLLAKADYAIRRGMDDTLAASVIQAKLNHPGWKNQTGTAEGSIAMRPSRRISETLYRGEFGSYAVNYFIWLEIGHFVLSTRGFQHQGGHPETSFGRFIPGDHTLRRAADAVFPSVGERIRRYLAA